MLLMNPQQKASSQGTPDQSPIQFGGQRDFASFQQNMWSNPQMQQMAQWQQQFPMQFMPPMMAGPRMQFPTGGQFNQYPIFPGL
jgi:hypothetical protein